MNKLAEDSYTHSLKQKIHTSLLTVTLSSIGSTLNTWGEVLITAKRAVAQGQSVFLHSPSLIALTCSCYSCIVKIRVLAFSLIIMYLLNFHVKNNLLPLCF